MPQVNEITLEMLLEEQTRLYEVMKKSYPQQVNEGKLTPYTRDHRYRCAEKIISMLRNSIHQKNKVIQKLNNQLVP